MNPEHPDPFQTVREHSDPKDLYETLFPGKEIQEHGSSLQIQCPLPNGHTDKNPSATLDPEDGLFYCHVCGEGGSVIDLVIQQQGVDAKQAAIWLAERYKLNLPQLEETHWQTSRKRLSREQRQHQALHQFVHEAHAQLTSGHRKHLRTRGLSDELIDELKIGIVSSEQPDDVQAAKLIGAYVDKDDGQATYLPAHRYLIPIREHGRIVYWTAYDPNSDLKYLFPSQASSDLKKPLWGQENIGQDRDLYIVEGVFDYLTLLEADLAGLCTLGVSPSRLNEAKLEALSEHPDNIYILFDNDAGSDSEGNAGQESARELAETLWPTQVKMLRLPDVAGESSDPNRLLTHHCQGEPKRFRETLESLESQTLLEDKLEAVQAASIQEEADQAERLYPFISQLDSVRRDQAIDRLMDAFDSSVRKRAVRQAIEEADPTASEAKGPSPGTNGPSQQHDELLDEIGIEVLGERSDGEILLFNPEQNTLRAFNRVDDFRYHDALQLAGSRVEKQVAPRGGSQTDGRCDFRAVQRAIALEARKRSLANFNHYGQGIHPWEKGRVLLVSGQHVGIVDPDAPRIIRRSTSPILDDAFFGLQPGKGWVRWDTLEENLARMQDLKARRSVLGRLHELIAQWPWKHDVNAQLVVGGLLQTFLQSFPDWKPHYALIGPAGSGKSLLFQRVFKPLLGGFCPRVFGAGSTEAGIRQTLFDSDTRCSDRLAVVRDEFEQIDGHQRQRIMDILREANRGGYVTKGTASQETTYEFEVDHSVWICTTEFGGEATQADWDRFLRLYLEGFDDDEHAEIPDRETLRALGQRLMALALQLTDCARQAFGDRKTWVEQGYNFTTRMKINHLLPYQLFHTAIASQEKPEELSRHGLPQYDSEAMFHQRQATGRVQKDKHQVLDQILSHRERVKDELDHVMQSVRAMIPRASERPMKKTLASLGIKVVDPKGDDDGKPKVYFHPDTVARQCLQDTAYARKNVRDYLLEIKEAERDRQRLAGQNARGVSIPRRVVLNADARGS